MRRLPLSLILATLVTAFGAGCELYDGPPKPAIIGADDGLLDDRDAPIVLSFGEPIDPTTLKARILRLETDVEGNLLDEDDDPETEPEEFFLYTPDFPGVGGTAELVDGNTALVIRPSAPLPVGPKLVLVVEPGLADLAGNVTKVRKRLQFAYAFKLECNAPSAVFPPGHYFLLADIDKPISTQVQLWASFQVDATTGRVTGQCTNADRDKTQVCPMACGTGEVCRLLPEPACVPPSERAGTVDEYPDYVPYAIPPTGYSFAIDGCAVDQADGKAVFVTAPVDVVVQQPPVTLRNVTLTAEFSKDAAGVLRGSGTLLADQVLIGTTPSGPGEGNLVARLVSEDEVPPNIPDPPASP